LSEWRSRRRPLIGWATAMVYGAIHAYRETGTRYAWLALRRLRGTDSVLWRDGLEIALTAFVIVAVVLTLIFRFARVAGGADEKLPQHHTVGTEEPVVHELPANCWNGLARRATLVDACDFGADDRGELVWEQR